MIIFYKLDKDKNTTTCTLEQWVEQWTKMPKKLKGFAFEAMNELGICTIFVGIDYNSHVEGPTLLFETIVFDKELNEVYIDRYSTWSDARKGHKKAKKWVQNGRVNRA